MEKLYIVFVLVLFVFNTPILSQKVDPEFTINEELALNTQVGNLAEIPNIFSSDQERKSTHYGILNQAKSPGSLFNISRTEGTIFVAQRIDREKQCPMLEHCILKINVLASAQIPSVFDSRVITVNFRIIDINDNYPTFDRSAVVLKVTEGNSVDSVMKLTGANDRDSKPEFRVKNYTLDSYHDVFSLSAIQTLDGSSEMDLTLKQSLDRETKAQYAFTITASDGGFPPKSSTLSVTVDVIDTNDNEPVFVNSSYNVNIDSKASLNKVILQVSASDADEGNNSLLTYDFSNLQKTLLQSLFHINSTTGEISVIGPLRSGITEFYVEAQDSGIPRLKAQTVVRATVVNSGNIPPRISITTVGASFEQNIVSILEPGGKNLFVAFALVEDDGEDDAVCQISNDVFKMVPEANKGYKIVLQGVVDRETISSYDLSISCTDSGDPPLNSTVQFTVKIEDANDNAPEFGQKRYSRTISEGKKNGEFVIQVSASDRDSGNNGAVVYSLDPLYTDNFRIDPTTGVITAIGDLDRESNPALTFKVYATDQGKSLQRNGSADISIVLDDINDNAPILENKVFRFQTVEEIEAPRIIGNLKAHDLDSGVNGEFEFYFTGSLDGSDGAFTVLLNGSIVSSMKLDREERVNYSFSIMVRDKGEPPLMSSSIVVVTVLDINDNSPAILFPKSRNHTVVISTVPETGVVISRVIAYDDDEGDNGSLRFTIVSGNEDTAFEISETTGEFRISHSSRLKNRKQYEVGIVVADRGNPPKINTTSLKIDVIYDNSTQIAREMKKQEDYIIIVAVVAAITVIFSTIIIIAICVVFQKDKHSGRKQPTKSDFQNLQISENPSHEDKVGCSVQESSTGTNYQQYSMNNLSFPPGDNQNPNKDGTFFQLQIVQPDVQKLSSKVKAVSFSLDELDMGSSIPLHTSPRDDLPPFLTFGSSFGRSSDEQTFQPRSTMARQVSGVTYAPVSTCEHGDDVISDTSADTTTSDSGRGNSVDDVNFDQMLTGNNSPVGMSFRMRSDDLPSPNEQKTSSDNSRKPTNHVRFTENAGNSYLPNLPPKQRQPIRYDGARPVSRNPTSSNSKDSSSAPKGFPYISNSTSIGVPNDSDYQKSLSHKLSTFGTPGKLSVTSADDDGTTTTSGSYIINPEDIRLDSYVGVDIIV